MTPVNYTSETIRENLELTRDLKAERTSAGVEYKPQRQTGSIWGQLLANKVIKPHDVCWAMTPDGTWLGVLLDTGRGKAKFFDLRKEEERNTLNSMKPMLWRLVKQARKRS